MSSDRVTVFSSTNEDNVHTLVGILKSYKISSQVTKLNDKFNISVSEKAKPGAEAIISKYVRKPGERKEPHLVVLDFMKENKVTSVIIFLTVLTFCISSFGQDLNRLTKLFISDVSYHRSVVDNQLVEKAVFGKEISEVKSGQIWRLFTNAFIHNNLIHLLINLLLVFHLGRIIEKVSGFSYLLILSLVVIPLTSYCQFAFGKSPLFGGLNAVVLAYYGFIVLRSIYDTRYFGKVQTGSFIFMGGWLISGFLNFFHINMSYGAVAGLIIGVLWGFLSSRLLPEERMIPRKDEIL
ncbi:MAG: rhomboid family intramembrane serine protease [Lentisphaeraceae bacterium]|nr:rhomboid family intramembrane serine protease [Lentisphaeraceae bacterium]